MRCFYWLFSCLYLSLFACTSISREPLSSDTDPNADFKNYRSFSWLPQDSSKIQNPLYDNQIIEKNIKSYVNEELGKLGYEENSKNPDILLRYIFMIEKKQETINYPIYTNAPYPNQITYEPYNPNVSNFGSYNNPTINPYYYNQNSPYNVNYYANNYPYNNGFGFPSGTVPAYRNGYGQPISSATYVAGTSYQQIEVKEGTLIIDVIDGNTNQLIWRGWSAEPLSDPNSFEKRLPFEIKTILNQYPGKSGNIK